MNRLLRSRLKFILQYSAMLLLAAVLLWLSLRTIPPVDGESRGAFIWTAWERSNKWYLLMMAVVAILSHALRAYRWKMLLVPAGHKVGMLNSFLSLMIGYLVNLAVPRGGEISRCYNLLKLERTPIEVSFGTVVAERIVDVVCLVLLIALSFVVEWDKLMAFIGELPIGEGRSGMYTWLIIGIILFAVFFSLYFFLRKSERVKKIVVGFKRGLLSVFALEHPWVFIAMTFLIWFLYFVMSYFVILAFPETEMLGWGAVLILFAIGAIAMAAPLPGGAGSYHTLVPLGLVLLYNMPKGDAIAFVFIFHAWQTFIMIVFGVLSLVISYWKMGWKK